MKIKIIKNKYQLLLVVLLLLVGIFVVGNFVQAGISLNSSIATVMGWIITPIIYLLGRLLTVAIGILIWVAQYDDFVGSSAVEFGWVVVRDLCNMFFILILLLIAFATILRVETYNAKKLLPKLIIMAILINFSKTICGIIIDLAQVVMLTFVNSFKAAADGNFIKMLGIDSIMRIKEGGEEVTATSIIGSYILALIYILVSLVVILTMVFVLVMRMVMLWIYIVLSPFAYLLSAFPQGQKYATQWWDEFSKNVIVGPVLAFFIWLSLISASEKGLVSEFDKATMELSPSASVTEAGSFDHMVKFIIAIAMLIGGLMIAQQLGGAVGRIAGRGMDALQKGKGLAWGGIKGAADWINRKQASEGGLLPWKIPIGKGRALRIGTGTDFNMVRQAARVKGSLERGKAHDLASIERSASARLAKGGLTGAFAGVSALGWGDQYLRGPLGIKGAWSAVSPLFHGRWTAPAVAKDYRGKQKEQAGFAQTMLSQEGYDKKKTDLDTALTAEKGNVHALRGEETELRGKKKTMVAGTPEEEKLGKEIDEISGKITASENVIKDTEDQKSKLEDQKEKAMKEEDDKGRTLFVDSEGEANMRRSEYRKKARRLGKGAGAYTIHDYEGIRARKAAMNEAARGIDSTNEDELISQFESAVARMDVPLSQALFAALSKIGGSNTCLNKFGYQATSGLTKEERGNLEKDKKYDEIHRRQGTMDFMRDIFGKQLNMDEQSVLLLQSDYSAIGEQGGKEHLIKSVGVGDDGRFRELNHREREELKLREAMKIDIEKNIRNNNRLFFGAEDMDTKEFNYSDFGLSYLITNIGTVFKEIQGNRLNKSSAKAMSEPQAIKALTDKLKDLKIETIINPKTNTGVGVNDFVRELKNYAKITSEESMAKLLESEERAESEAATASKT